MVAIDPMTKENGGLFVFPGSHHDHKPVKGNPSLSREYACGQHGKPLLLELTPGDAVFFHPYLVHFSEENRSDRARRAFINGFACPGANHAQYPGKGSGEVITLVK